ncbi:MAG: YndM family protein [Bacillota bacterium]
MRHTTVLLIKFVTCVIAFGIGLDLFFDATIVDILSFSLLITVVSYVVGELIILPQLGKRAAAVADFLLTYLSVWIFGSILLENYLQIAWGSIISAFIVTVAEVFIHLFLEDRLTASQTLKSRKPVFNPIPAYGTEFAKEEDFRDLTQAKFQNEDK